MVVAEGYDDDESFAGDDDNERLLEDRTGGSEAGTFIDIVLFQEPSSCANTRYGCDWTRLGVGASDSAGNLRWCCSDDAAALGLCDGGPKREGRLILDSDKFRGQHKFLAVPASGGWKRKVVEGMFKNGKEGTSATFM